MRAYLALPFLLSAAAALWPEPGSFVRAQSDVPPPGFTIAFIGDQGFNPFSWAVLKLIKDEGADAVLHSGDFDYLDLPFLWEAQINEFLGADFPYFTSVGNHDADKFRSFLGYQYFMEARLERLGIPWEGDLGVQSVVKYKGISFMLTAPGTFGPGDGFHDVYIQQKLAEDPSIWRISSWHKNMNQMQVGGKSDSTGWGVYEESRRGGAIIATAHEHSYSRSHLLSDMQNQSVASTANTLVVSRDDPNTPEDEGRSFVFVSGLGGQDIRDQERCLPFTPPYGCNGEWASIYTSDQGAAWGALFGVFNYQGDPRLAYFYFKDILGRVPDEFFVRSTVGEESAPVDLLRPISGRRLVIVNALPENVSRNRIGFLSRDAGISLADPDSLGDPRCGAGDGGRIEISSPASGHSFSASLPCQNWKLVLSEGRPYRYRYWDRKLDHGPCRIVSIRAGKIWAACSGRGPSVLDYDLEVGQAEAPVDVRIETGSSVAYCARFGGTVVRTGSDGETFYAGDAPPPASCPPPSPGK